jgi:hypothetical protein
MSYRQRENLHHVHLNERFVTVSLLAGLLSESAPDGSAHFGTSLPHKRFFDT